jgi:hypothetical protein
VEQERCLVEQVLLTLARAPFQPAPHPHVQQARRCVERVLLTFARVSFQPAPHP